jgi:hypothetical protein
MPELLLPRSNKTPPPMVCMYCGRPATHSREFEVEHHPTPRGGGGADITPVPTGDDPVSGVIALLLLPFVIWDAVKAVSAALSRPRANVPPKPARPVPVSRVAVTTCDRHRWFVLRFIWAGLGLAVLLAGLWVWAVIVTRQQMGTENVDLATVLLTSAIIATIAFPIGLSFWYTLAGPVIVDRVTPDAAILDRVRPAYFTATGRIPADP